MNRGQHQGRYEQLIQDGLQSYTRGDLRHALMLLENAIALDPQRPDGFAQRGAILAEYGDVVQAERDLRTALTFRTCVVASYQLALILSDQQRHAEAIMLLERALAQHSSDSELWHLLALFLIERMRLRGRWMRSAMQ